MFMVSNCDDLSGRYKYVEELMKYIKVDSYGKCLHNKDSPEHVPAFESNFWDYKLNMMSKYYFTITFENSIADSYVTEKLWQVLQSGTIPVYFGPENINEFLPHPDSIINVRDFASPQELAQYLQLVLRNLALYDRYTNWYKQPISTKFQEILNAPFYYSPTCVLCSILYHKGNLSKIKIAKF